MRFDFWGVKRHLQNISALRIKIGDLSKKTQEQGSKKKWQREIESNRGLLRREALALTLKGMFLLVTSTGGGLAIKYLSSQEKSDPRKPLSNTLRIGTKSLPNISPSKVIAQRELMKAFLKEIDTVFEVFKSFRAQGKVMENRYMNLILGDVQTVNQNSYLLQFPSIRRDTTMLMRSPGGAVVLWGKYKNGVLELVPDVSIPIEDRGGVVIIHQGAMSDFEIKATLFHEFSHFSAWKTGQLDPLFERTLPLYEKLQDYFKDNPSLLIGPPPLELPAYLDMLEYILDHAPAGLKKKMAASTYLFIVNDIFLNLKALKQLLRNFPYKIELGDARQKDGYEIVEECFTLIWEVEKQRLSALNAALKELGLPAIDPSISAEAYEIQKEKYSRLFPDLTLPIKL